MTTNELQLLGIGLLGVVGMILFLYDFARPVPPTRPTWWRVIRLMKGAMLGVIGIAHLMAILYPEHEAALGRDWYRPALIVLLALINSNRPFDRHEIINLTIGRPPRE